MAKQKAGLPDDFDIGVTAEDLRGPATLPGYLDDDVPAFPPIRASKPVAPKEVAAQVKEESREPLPTVPVPASVADPIRLETSSTLTNPVLTNTDVVASLEQESLPEEEPNFLETTPATQTQGRRAPEQEIRRRLQINLDPDSDRMVNELLDLLSSQSAEHRIKVSELFQALIVNLYNARGEIALGSLPVRGRWGSVTARAFPLALAGAVREAIVTYDQNIGGNPFKKVVGG